MMKTWLAIASCICSTPVVFAADKPLAWPQFRGPEGSGIAALAKPPVEFGPEQNLAWKVAVPGGLSSPVVAGDKLVITAFEEGKLFTIAYDRANGTEAWRAAAPVRQLEAYHKIEGSPATSTPATDGERIVSYFGSYGLLCYDFAGKELWRYELPTAKLLGEFGSGVSPIIAEGLVILVRDERQDSKIMAVDAVTGHRKWETKRISPVSYATPVVWDTPGGKQIAAAGHARLAGYDLATGTEKWFVTGVPAGTCASPVVAEGMLYFAGTSGGGEDEEQTIPGFDDLLKQLDADKDGALSRAEAEKAFEGFFDNQDTNKDGAITRDEWEQITKLFAEGKDVALALKPGGAGDATATQVQWKHERGLPYLASAIVYKGQLLMVKDGGIVTALNPQSGEQLYRGRIADGKYYASPVAANGYVYCTSLNGEVTVLEAGVSEMKVAARNPAFDERTVATPAIADDTIYIRTDKHLYAFARRK